MTTPSDDNGHSLPIQGQNELVAYISGKYVVIAVHGRHPDRLFPQDYPVGSLDAEQSRALAFNFNDLPRS